MTDQITTITMALFGALSVLIGSQVQMLAEAMPASGVMAPWIEGLLGPLGTLCAMIYALRWAVQRMDRTEAKLDRTEAKLDQRAIDREEDVKRLIIVLEQNSSVLRDVKTIMEKVSK